MTARDIIGIVIAIAILYVAFRVGAFLLRITLGLVFIVVVVWLVMRLFRRGR